MTPKTSAPSLSRLYESLQFYDAERLRLIHELSGAMLRDPRTYLDRSPGALPKPKRFRFGCGHDDSFFFSQVEPIELMMFEAAFMKRPCLSCLARHISNYLCSETVLQFPSLQVKHTGQLPRAEVTRWQEVADFAADLDALPLELQPAWQHLANDVLIVLTRADGDTWLNKDESPLYARVLDAARLSAPAFVQAYGEAREKSETREEALREILASTTDRP